MLDDWLTEQGVSPGRTQCCNSWGAIAGMLRQGLGLGFLPTAWARILIQRGDLHRLPGLAPLRPLPYTFQWRRDDPRPMLESLRVLAQDTLDFEAPAGMSRLKRHHAYTETTRYAGFRFLSARLPQTPVPARPVAEPGVRPAYRRRARHRLVGAARAWRRCAHVGRPEDRPRLSRIRRPR
ncbi:hypothetical protein G6F57_019563 [Rhizopus arrhizus]|nr:hypothetical protein G6F57_019563 [Rhizopus arrhizus]